MISEPTVENWKCKKVLSFFHSRHFRRFYLSLRGYNIDESYYKRQFQNEKKNTPYFFVGGGAGTCGIHLFQILFRVRRRCQSRRTELRGVQRLSVQDIRRQAGFAKGNKGTASVVQSYEFDFSITDEAVADSLMRCSGKTVELHYKEYLGALPWRGQQKYIVDRIIAVN